MKPLTNAEIERRLVRLMEDYANRFLPHELSLLAMAVEHFHIAAARDKKSEEQDG